VRRCTAYREMSVAGAPRYSRIYSLVLRRLSLTRGIRGVPQAPEPSSGERRPAVPSAPEFHGLTRQTKQGKTRWAIGSKYYNKAKHQNWQCPVCGEHLLNGEEIETHHIFLFCHFPVFLINKRFLREVKASHRTISS
jgi:hypothetical protein